METSATVRPAETASDNVEAGGAEDAEDREMEAWWDEVVASEGNPAKGKKLLTKPSQEEVDAHERSCHVPFRSWCKHCVMGQAVSDPHRACRLHVYER